MKEFKKIRGALLDKNEFKYLSPNNGSLLEMLNDSTQKIDIFSLPEVENDKPCLHAAKQYKTYNTIRRDLRMAYDICNYAINLQEQISQNSYLINNEDNRFHVYLTSGALMHSVVLYARWFLATTKKSMLNKKIFFISNSEEEKAHTRFINLRNEYIAHYENDLLGSDQIWVHFNEEGKVIKTHSDWLIKIFPELPLFKTCIEIVHNKIDAEILPEKQKKLDEQLNRIYGSP